MAALELNTEAFLRICTPDPVTIYDPVDDEHLGEEDEDDGDHGHTWYATSGMTVMVC